MSDEKARRLADLGTGIVEELKARGYEPWLWPRCENVAGWEGTAPIIFSALNPSKGGGENRFPTRADRMLFWCLSENGFADAHLTDVLKAKATNDDAPSFLRNNSFMEVHRAWLLEEVAIVRPRLIVAVGQRAHDFLRRWLSDDERLRCIPHYAWAVRFPKRAGTRFADAMVDLRRQVGVAAGGERA